MTLTQDQKDENERRAQRGRNALDAYAVEVGSDPEFRLVDLLVDLMHCSDADDEKPFFEEELASALQHFEAELKGEL